ncbi:DHH family phosphoesterase [Candidatus Peregrinibacteria bacterium]|nr:DHH family phosphoesterase [Candidatus Peregrinibacteria bacterium]
MKLEHHDVQEIGKWVENARRILIIPHKNPDGDAIGSALGLYRVFSDMGKEAEVACYDVPPTPFNFIPDIEKVKVGLPELTHDIIFIVDSGATHLTGFNESHPRLFDKSLPTVNIDHHPTNENYGRLNLVAPTAASTTSILYRLVFQLDWPLSREAATCFLTGIYTDTGSFMHSNTDSLTLQIAARLVARGADLRSISKELFNTTKISTLQLWGRVLKNTYQTGEGVTVSVVTEKDFEDTGADYSEMTGVVDYVNSVPDSAYSVILSERAGKVKGSLRTLRDEINVSDIASQWGGGGHAKAAGFTVPGKLEREIRWKVVE